MENTNHENGIDFNPGADYLGEQIADVHNRPFRYLTVQALKTELLKALNENDDPTANAITKELQSRNPNEDGAFGDRSLGTNERKHAPR